MQLAKFSFGIGDRFGRQGEAQLQAFQQAAEMGVEIAPVWNKSHREHTTIGTEPDSVRHEADAAVKALAWQKPYYVDADHINAGNLEGFLASSDFFTLDVAEAIGKEAEASEIYRWVERCRPLIGQLEIPGIEDSLEVTESFLREVAATYLLAVQQAAKLYRRIAEVKGDNCIIEVSMDETTAPQKPAELFFILEAIAAAGIPAQTIAPKFSGHFNKGVDYVGSVADFEREFAADTAVVREAVKRFNLPVNFKLSVHSGSDKFSIYPAMRRVMRRFDSGIHLKTAGTTWLEECVGLATADDEGLTLVKDIYRAAYQRRTELTAPYATVIDIDESALPAPEQVAQWDARNLVASLRHDPEEPRFNPSLRQLLHVGYKVAAEMGDRYLGALDKHRRPVGQCVTENILERHVRPLFLG